MQKMKVFRRLTVFLLIGAVVFVLTGSFLLVSCIRRMLAKQRGDQDKKED